MKKFWIFIIIVILLIVSIVLLKKTQSSSTTNSNSAQPTLSSLNTNIFGQLATWLPEAKWSTPQTSTQTTLYGSATGKEVTGTVTNQNANMPHFDNASYLKTLGFSSDVNTQADGPGSSTWGYKKTTGDQIQLILFSYKTKPSNSNPSEPLQFNCPCKTAVSVFVSNPFVPQKQ